MEEVHPQQILDELTESLPVQKREEVMQRLSRYLNHLLLRDFPALVHLLYRVDVPEQKLKAALQENAGTDAGKLMADLIAERQAAKAAARAGLKQSPPDINAEEERW